MTSVAAVVAAGDVREAERQARAALSKGADLVEFRLDRLRAPSVDDARHLAKVFGPRAIATLRSPAEGGGHPPARGDRAAFLRELADLGFRYVDAELSADGPSLDVLASSCARRNRHLIVSRHFDRPVAASEAEDALEACLARGHVGKVALPAADVESAIDLVDLARKHAARSHHVVVIGMGAEGMLTRALAEDSSQEIHYAALGGGVAPGQLPLEAAARIHGKTPAVFGLLGHPLGHSLSPWIHEAAFQDLRLPAVYLPFDVAEDGLESLFRSADSLRLRGLNVTIPYKETVADRLDELDTDSEALGAVNTVVLQDGWTKGANTDVFGFRISLRSLGLRLGDRDALVVGAGGAAKAVVHVLAREGARVHVANRTRGRAEDLADDFEGSVDAVDLADLPEGGPWDLLVNATPLGTVGFPRASPVPESVVAKSRYVYDLVYNPPRTPLLAIAERLRVPHTSGLDMLLHQAAKSFELWTGKAAPFEAMRQAAQEALR